MDADTRGLPSVLLPLAHSPSRRDDGIPGTPLARNAHHGDVAMKPSVLISMIGCGRMEGTQKCLGKALRTAAGAEFVLTNNASKDKTGEMFEAMAANMAANGAPTPITIFHEKENTGFIPPGNRAFHMAVTRGLEFTILLNDDTDPPAGWLERLLAPFEDPTVALTCPRGTCCTLDASFGGHGGRDFEYCEGSCLAIRNSAILSFSPTLFDENLTGIYGDDSNLSLRAREKGWKIARADFDMPHIRSATTRSPEVSAFCEFHKEKNHRYNVKRWAHYLKVRRFDFPIIISRSYAIGDVLLTTPIIRAIAKSNPLSPIHVQTDFPEIFARNPYVHSAAKRIERMPDAMVIDLDGAYEKRQMTHIVDSYEAEAREQLPGMFHVELRTEMFPSEEDYAWARRVKGAAPEHKLALIGCDRTTWKGKNWPEDNFAAIRKELQRMGWMTLTVGSKGQEVLSTIHQLAALCSVSQLFIGNDSFPMHCAQAMGCPVVGIFGPTLPRYILTQGSKAAGAAALPSVPCAGQRHRVLNSTFVDCDGDCIRSVTTEAVMQAFAKLEIA